MELKPGYKQTEVGVIPEEWELDSIGKVFRLINGRAFKPEDWKLQGTPIIRIQNLNDPDAPFNYSHAPVEERHRVKAGDLLFAWSGTTGTSFGARIWKGPCGVLNQHIFKVITDERKLAPSFSLLILQRIQEDIEKKAHGFKASFVHVKKSDLVGVPLPVPPLPQQRAIAEALGDVDALLDALDQIIAKKRDLKQAAVQQLLIGRKRLPGFSGQWRSCLLSDVATPRKGKGIRKDEVVADGLPCVRYGEIYTHHQDYIRRFYSFIPAEVAKRTERLRKGDLLFAGSGETAEEIGKCVAFLGDEEAYAGGDIVIFRPIAENSMYFGYLMNEISIAAQKARLGHGDAVVHISAKNLGRLRLRLPAPDEQAAIATVISDMDAEIATLEARRDKTRALKQGMMQELLTGRTRLVSSEAASLPQKEKRAVAKPSSHNWEINEAVVISVLAKQFGTETFPLGRKRYTKLAYLLHRHVEREPEGYLKKAAGPYNPRTKYKGPEGIAQRNGYVRTHANGQYSGFVAAENIGKAEEYFQQWYGPEALKWLEQFRFRTNNQLELLATVDMAVRDLQNAREEISLQRVKDVIRSHPEWEAKLTRPVFADANITAAMKTCEELFD